MIDCLTFAVQLGLNCYTRFLFSVNMEFGIFALSEYISDRKTISPQTKEEKPANLDFSTVRQLNTVYSFV